MIVRAQRISRRSALLSALAAAWPAWLTAAVCAAVALGGAGWHELLEYRRAAIFDGQWWRLVSGNLVHLNLDHLLMDMSGLALLWILCEPVLAGWRWLLVTAAGMLAVGFGLLLFTPAVAWYVGISGVLHTYWAAGAILLLAARHREAWLLAAGLVAKLVWEQTVGPMPFSETVAGGPVVTAAHLWGAIGGVLTGLCLLAANRLSTTKKEHDDLPSSL